MMDKNRQKDEVVVVVATDYKSLILRTGRP